MIPKSLIWKLKKLQVPVKYVSVLADDQKTFPPLKNVVFTYHILIQLKPVFSTSFSVCNDRLRCYIDWNLPFLLVWMSMLMFVAFPVSGICAAWYIMINPLTTITDNLNVSKSIYLYIYLSIYPSIQYGLAYHDQPPHHHNR